MRYTSLILVLLAAAPAQAERYEAWNDAGWIWGRDTQTDEVYRLSHFDTGIGEPVLAERLVAWIDSRYAGHWWPQTIYGFSWKALETYGDPMQAEFPIVLGMGSRSDLRLSWIPSETWPENNYWTAWRQGGGVWAYQVWPEPDYQHIPFEVLPDWTGDFELVGGEIHWPGGTTVLEAPKPVPEPACLALLGLAAAIWFWRRAR